MSVVHPIINQISSCMKQLHGDCFDPKYTWDHLCTAPEYLSRFADKLKMFNETDGQVLCDQSDSRAELQMRKEDYPIHHSKQIFDARQEQSLECEISPNLKEKRWDWICTFKEKVESSQDTINLDYEPLPKKLSRDTQETLNFPGLKDESGSVGALPDPTILSPLSASSTLTTPAADPKAASASPMFQASTSMNSASIPSTPPAADQNAPAPQAASAPSMFQASSTMSGASIPSTPLAADLSAPAPQAASASPMFQASTSMNSASIPSTMQAADLSAPAPQAASASQMFQASSPMSGASIPSTPLAADLSAAAPQLVSAQKTCRVKSSPFSASAIPKTSAKTSNPGATPGPSTPNSGTGPTLPVNLGISANVKAGVGMASALFFAYKTAQEIGKLKKGASPNTRANGSPDDCSSKKKEQEGSVARAIGYATLALASGGYCVYQFRA